MTAMSLSRHFIDALDCPHIEGSLIQEVTKGRKTAQITARQKWTRMPR